MSIVKIQELFLNNIIKNKIFFLIKKLKKKKKKNTLIIKLFIFLNY